MSLEQDLQSGTDTVSEKKKILCKELLERRHLCSARISVRYKIESRVMSDTTSDNVASPRFIGCMQSIIKALHLNPSSSK